MLLIQRFWLCVARSVIEHSFVWGGGPRHCYLSFCSSPVWHEPQWPPWKETDASVTCLNLSISPSFPTLLGNDSFWAFRLEHLTQLSSILCSLEALPFLSHPFPGRRSGKPDYTVPRSIRELSSFRVLDAFESSGRTVTRLLLVDTWYQMWVPLQSNSILIFMPSSHCGKVVQLFGLMRLSLWLATGLNSFSAVFVFALLLFRRALLQARGADHSLHLLAGFDCVAVNFADTGRPHVPSSLQVSRAEYREYQIEFLCCSFLHVSSYSLVVIQRKMFLSESEEILS